MAWKNYTINLNNLIQVKEYFMKPEWATVE